MGEIAIYSFFYGKVPLANLCKSIRYNGDTIAFIDEYSKIAEARFNTCYYFYDENTSYMVHKEVDKKNIICYDWLAFNSGGKHNVDFIQGEDQFINKIWFYSSDRIPSNNGVKDACSVSYLTEEQVDNFDFSETMAKFKIAHDRDWETIFYL